MNFHASPSLAKKIDLANFLHGLVTEISQACNPVISSFIGQQMAIQSGATSAKGKKLVAEVEKVVRTFETGFHGRPYGVNLMVWFSNSRNLMLKVTFFDNGENLGYAEFYLATAGYWTNILESIVEHKLPVFDLQTVESAISDVKRLEEELQAAKDKIPYFLKR